MKYIKNNTDNILIIKCLSEGKIKELKFPKKSITEVSDELDTLFTELKAYTNLFTSNVLVYTTKAEEKYEDDFTNYLKKWSYNTETDELSVEFKESLAGENLFCKCSVDGAEVTEFNFTVPDNAKDKFVISKEAKEYIEFRFYNDYYSDYPIAYSKRIKVYK